MSIKALRRRSREAQSWLGQCCLPLWAEVGLIRGQGFVAALEMNHRAAEAVELADVAGHAAMADLFDLSGRVGFDSERGVELAALARSHLSGTPPPAPSAAMSSTGQRSLAGQCADLRAQLIALPGDDNAISGAVLVFDELMDDFLTPEGGWIAGYTEDGQPERSDMPAYLARDLTRALSPLLALIEA